MQLVLLQARQSSVSAAAKAAASMVGGGYGSDEEVYRTASAVDAADGISYDSDDNQIIAGVRGNKVFARSISLIYATHLGSPS